VRNAGDPRAFQIHETASVDTQDRPLSWSAETLTSARNACSYVEMSTDLTDDKQQQILALGDLGWPLRRIEQATTVRREPVSGCLKPAGIAVRGRDRYQYVGSRRHPPKIGVDSGHSRTLGRETLRMRSPWIPLCYREEAMDWQSIRRLRRPARQGARSRDLQFAIEPHDKRQIPALDSHVRRMRKPILFTADAPIARRFRQYLGNANPLGNS